MVRIAPFRGVFYNPKKIRDLARVEAGISLPNRLDKCLTPLNPSSERTGARLQTGGKIQPPGCSRRPRQQVTFARDWSQRSLRRRGHRCVQKQLESR